MTRDELRYFGFSSLAWKGSRYNDSAEDRIRSLKKQLHHAKSRFRKARRLARFHAQENAASRKRLRSLSPSEEKCLALLAERDALQVELESTREALEGADVYWRGRMKGAGGEAEAEVERLNGELAKQSKEVKRLNAELGRAKADIQKLSDENAGLRVTYAAAKAWNEQLKRDVNALKEQAGLLKSDYEQAVRDTQYYPGIVRKLEEKLEVAERERKAEKLEKEAQGKENAKLTKENSRLTAERDRAQDALKPDANLAASHLILLQRYEKQTKSVELLTKEVEAEKSGRVSLAAANSGLDVEARSLRSDAVKLTSECAELRRTNQEALAGAESLRADVVRLTAELDGARTELSQVQAEVAAATARVVQEHQAVVERLTVELREARGHAEKAPTAAVAQKKVVREIRTSRPWTLFGWLTGLFLRRPDPKLVIQDEKKRRILLHQDDIDYYRLGVEIALTNKERYSLDGELAEKFLARFVEGRAEPPDMRC